MQLFDGILLAGARARQRRAGSFTAMLAWSVRYQLPLAEVVAAGTPQRHWPRLRRLLGNPLLFGPYAGLLRWRTRFPRGTVRIATEWEPDEPLAPLLGRRLGDWLPASYLAAVHDAQQRGTLAAELPHLTALLHDPHHDRVPLRGPCYLAALRLGLLLAVIGLASAYVLPRFAAESLYIRSELAADLPTPAPGYWQQQVMRETDRLALQRRNKPAADAIPAPAFPVWAAEHVVQGAGFVLKSAWAVVFGPPYSLTESVDNTWGYGMERSMGKSGNYVKPKVMGALLIILYAGYWAVLWLLILCLGGWSRRAWRAWSWTTQVREVLLWPVPLVGATMRQQRMLEGLMALRAAVAGGQDWPMALARQAEVFPVAWYRRRCRRAAAAIRAGERWDLAWQRARLTPPALDWVVAAGALREAPAATLATLETLLRAQFDAAISRGERWIELGTTLLGALLAGGFAVYVFWTLQVMVECAIAW